MMMTSCDTPRMSNVWDSEEFFAKSKDAFSRIWMRLANHCGPYAQYAVVPKHSGIHYHHIFTKDGINIVDDIRFTDNRLSEYARHICSYAGRRVDAACHDGTTTAMMVLSDIASKVAGHPDYADTLSTVFTEIINSIEDEKVTIDEFSKEFTLSTKEALSLIAYHQAMISSKGDKELSQSIAQVITSLPVELYGQYVLHHARVEKDEKYRVITQDADMIIPAQMFPLDYNYLLNTQYKEEDVWLLVSPDELIYDNPATEVLIQLIVRHIEDKTSFDKTLVVIATSYESNLVGVARTYNYLNKNKIVLMTTRSIHPTCMKYYTEALPLMAQVPHFRDVMEHDPLSAIIKGVNIHFKFSNVHISNVYPKDGGMYHPLYSSPDTYKPYTDRIKEIRTLLDDAQNSMDVDKIDDKALSHYVTIYRQMTCQTITDLQICGSSHDFLANNSVAIDAFGAVVSAIEEGFIFDGIQRLILITEELGLEYPDLNQEVIKIIRDAFARVQLVTYTGSKDVTLDEATYHTPFEYSVDASKFDYNELDVKTKVLTYRNLKADPDHLKDPSAQLLIQPIFGYTELCKRLRELLPKISQTSCLIDIEQ